MELNNSIEFVLFGKTPRYGHVKTRLFPEKPEYSLLIYKAFLKDFFLRYSLNCKLALRPLLDYHDENDLNEFHNFARPVSSLLEPIYQKPASFFNRLADGLEEIESPYFYLTGTDLPHFPFDYLNNISLSCNEVTIGPDRDGGFYFLAGPRGCAQLLKLEQDPQSICVSLVRNFQEAGFRVKLLKPWSDIDTASDLVNCLNHFCADELPYTYEALEKMDILYQQSLMEPTNPHSKTVFI